nr:zinc ABC transporter substrate-binding protein [Microbacterium protaetiae]
MKTRLLSLAALVASAVVLAGCSGMSDAAGSPDTAGSPDAGGKVQVVASTNVYGSIAEAVGGNRVAVTSIIASAAQDPHEFEASARDQLRVKNAALVIENGGGFDPFMDGLVQASGTDAQVITAATLSPEYPADGDLDTHADDADHDHDHLEGFNEHVFYDPAVMAMLAEKIADALGEIDPGGAAAYTANAQTFANGIQPIIGALGDLKAAHEGNGVFVTEPLPLYLTDAAGLDNKTPSEFSEAVEEGQDVAPATLLDALKIISSKQVAVVIINAQAAGAETDRVVQEAKDSGIPVLQFSELLPDGETYLTWMADNVSQLGDALG